MEGGGGRRWEIGRVDGGWDRSSLTKLLKTQEVGRRLLEVNEL